MTGELITHTECKACSNCNDRSRPAIEGKLIVRKQAILKRKSK